MHGAAPRTARGGLEDAPENEGVRGERVGRGERRGERRERAPAHHDPPAQRGQFLEQDGHGGRAVQPRPHVEREHAEQQRPRGQRVAAGPVHREGGEQRGPGVHGEQRCRRRARDEGRPAGGQPVTVGGLTGRDDRDGRVSVLPRLSAGGGNGAFRSHVWLDSLHSVASTPVVCAARTAHEAHGADPPPGA